MESLKDNRLARLRKMALTVVRSYSISVRQEHTVFISNSWPSSISRKDPAYLAWKFRSESTEEIKNLLLAVDNGKVTGQLGLIPVKIMQGQKVMDAQWGCNFKVLKEFEGTGYGSLLDIMSLETRTVTLGAAPTPQSEDIKIKLGFKKFEGPRIMAYPINFEYILKLKLAFPPSSILKILSSVTGFFFRLLHPGNYGKSLRSFAGVFKGSYKEVIHLIQRKRKNITSLHVLHDEEFLHWRCAEVLNYRTKTLSLYTHSGSFILYYPTPTYFYLYEFHFANQADRQNLLSAILSEARAMPSKALYTYANTLEEESSLRHFGFFGFRRKINVYAYSADASLLSGNSFYMNAYDSDSGI